MFKIIISHTLGTFSLQFQKKEKKIAYHSFTVGKMKKENMVQVLTRTTFLSFPFFFQKDRKRKTISKHISSPEMGPKDLQKHL